MKTHEMKVKKRLLRQAQNERRVRARLADLKRLHRAVWLGKHPVIAFFAAWFGLRLFDWGKRYDHRYILSWARKEKWSTARLATAIDMVDKQMRVRQNRVARMKDAIRRRARNIMKWNRKQQEKTK